MNSRDLEPDRSALEDLIELMQLFVIEMELLEDANKTITEPSSRE